jgi:hypothetical protein
MNSNNHYDFLIIGAGACGLMAGIQSAKRGLSVCLLEKLPQAGRKILISGGGRCNFTNLNATPENYLSQSKHFMKSVLREWPSSRSVEFFEGLGITGVEKKLGQLFPENNSAEEVRDRLLDVYLRSGGKIFYNVQVTDIETLPTGFVATTSGGTFSGINLAVLTGGLAYPQLGASSFALKCAEKWGLAVTSTEPALVPLVPPKELLPLFKNLQGLSMPVIALTGKKSFKENILFAHFGITGPAILQISSYWKIGEPIVINFFPGDDLNDHLVRAKLTTPKKQLNNFLLGFFPERFLLLFDFDESTWSTNLASLKKETVEKLCSTVHQWSWIPTGTMGYAKAEVMRGGIDTAELNASTLMSKKIPNLYFGGEAVDVTGWLGGYNFQWAWACGYVIGSKVLK